MTQKMIHNNSVENYFKNNTSVKLSIAKLKKILNISDSEVYYLAMNSSEVRIVKPIEVGSNKNKLAVFTYESKEDRQKREEKEALEKAEREAKREVSNVNKSSKPTIDIDHKTIDNAVPLTDIIQ
jgi:hypothetical protein